MPTVYVREQGSVVRKRGGRIVIEKDKAELAEIRLRETELVCVFGNVQVTTQALGELLDRGIPLAIYTRNGRLKGHLSPEENKNVELRMKQYAAATDAEQSLGAARVLVGAKLWNSSRVVAAYRAHYPSDGLAAAQERLEEASGRVGEAGSAEELLGMEGAGAATYFEAMKEMNRSDLPFPGRRKHPATDPLNALLSLGYTMVMNELRSMTEGLGLEPHVGFLHRPDYGRPSLALDLLEPFRAPLVDRLALRLVNERVLTEADFARRAAGEGAGSVILMPDSWRRWLEEYEAAMRAERAGGDGDMRFALAWQASRVVRWLRDGEEFKAYRMEA